MPRLMRHVILATIVLLLGRSVEASSPWGWLQKLSGPGEFERRAPGLDVPVWSLYPRCQDGQTLDDRLFAPAFTTSQYKANADERFDRVDLVTYSLVVYIHPAGLLHRDMLCNISKAHSSRLNALDIGTGVVWYRFTGDATAQGVGANGVPLTAQGPFTRTALPLRFKITPSELWSPSLEKQHRKTRKILAMFSYTFNVDLGVGSFDQSNFNFKGQGVYHAEHKALWSGGILVDFTTLFFR